MSEHLEDVSHDVVSNFLKHNRITARQVWELVKGLIRNTPESFLIIDDSVQNKQYSKSIELVKKHIVEPQAAWCAGLAWLIWCTATVRSIILSITEFTTTPQTARPITAGGTRNDHFRDMLINAVAPKGIRAKNVLFDSWYAAWQNLKLVDSLKLTFYTTLKSNRLVSSSKGEGYIHLEGIDWTPERLKTGVTVKLNTHKGH